jgi:hypothetical protein
MTRLTRILLGAAAYAGVTFPFAYVWHLVMFEDRYVRLGAFTRAEPIVALGFLTIVLQGVLLATAFEAYTRGAATIRHALRFAAVAGTFLWSSQVLAFAAKHAVSSLGDWLLIESAYFALQFTLVGLAFGALHARVAVKPAFQV